VASDVADAAAALDIIRRLAHACCHTLPQLPDDCDSNMARAIQASLEDARMQQMRQQEQQREQQQQQQQQQQQAGASGGGGGCTAAPGEVVQDSTAVVDPTRPSDADIIAFENQIRCGTGGGIAAVLGYHEQQRIRFKATTHYTLPCTVLY
jgi:hypothetical protein